MLFAQLVSLSPTNGATGMGARSRCFLDHRVSENRGFLRRRSGSSPIISGKNSKNSVDPLHGKVGGPVPFVSALQPERKPKAQPIAAGDRSRQGLSVAARLRFPQDY